MRKKTVSETLLPKGRTIFFNEELHKYTDDLNHAYTSVTTVIGKYTEDFKMDDIAAACERIGKNPNHPKYLKYAGKSKKQIIWEWQQINKEACDKGTIKHNFLETAIKESNGYKRNAKGFINDKIYTIDDIIAKHNYGKVNLKYFETKGVKEKYPKIYNILKDFVKLGYKIYAEIGVYDAKNLISGLIDVLLVKDNDFIILDWKTNKAPIRFESGYYDKDSLGKLKLDTFIKKDERFKYPLDDLEDSVGNHYTMQLSTYAYLVETFGFNCKGLILCHIRTIEDAKDEEGNDVEVVEIYTIDYLKDKAESMISHHSSSNISNTAINLFS